MAFTAVAVFGFGFLVMRGLDTRMEECSKKSREKSMSPRLSIAFENPMVISAVMPLLERFSRVYPNCEINLLCGNAQEIQKKVWTDEIDFGLIHGENDFDTGQSGHIRVVLDTGSLYCNETNLVIEPLQYGADTTTVIWNKKSDKNYICYFADLLTSMQKQ